MNNTRFYKDALGLAPCRCLCGRRLPKPFHGNPLNDRQGDGWHVVCVCHRVYRWVYPNVWKERHELPLFDTRKEIPDNMGKG